MKKVKTFTEGEFDRIFNEKDIIKYEFDSNKMGRRDQKIVKELNAFKINGKKCLDIGPGTGRWLQFFKHSGAKEIAAIDISQESLNRCSKLCYKTQKANVEFETFDFKSNYFDIVISFMLLEHIVNPANYIKEILRVSKPGGMVLLTIPNIVSFVSRVRVLLGIMPLAVTGDPTHVRFYTKKELKKLFRPYNIKPVLIPTSISLNPLNANKIRIPSNNIIKSLDDHLLIKLSVTK